MWLENLETPILNGGFSHFGNYERTNKIFRDFSKTEGSNQSVIMILYIQFFEVMKSSFSKRSKDHHNNYTIIIVIDTMQ